MKIKRSGATQQPIVSAEREAQILEYVNIATKSQPKRLAYYNSYLNDILDNTSENMLYPYLESLVSTTYYPENVMLEVVADETIKESDEITNAVVMLTKEINDDFYSSNLDTKFWDFLIYGYALGFVANKVTWSSEGVRHRIVMPWDLCLLYEDGMSLHDKSQVVVHRSWVPVEKARRIYGEINVQEKTELSFGGDKGFIASGRADLIAAYKASLDDSRESFNHLAMFVPEQSHGYTLVMEVWCWEEEEQEGGGEPISDYRIYHVINDKIVKVAWNNVLPKTLPFVAFIPEKLEFYSWGRSSLHYMLPLTQIVRDGYDLFKNTVEKLIDPAVFFMGLSGELAKEIQDKMRSKGEAIPIPQLGVEIKPYQPFMSNPEVLLRYVETYKQAIRDVSSMSEIVMGKPVRNVRSTGYANILTQFAASSLKRRAAIVETFIEGCMTLHGRLLVESNAKYKALLGVPFRVEVSAHSTSPITQQNYYDILFAMMDNDIMPPDEIIELLPLPKKAELKSKIKEYMMMKINIQQKAKEANKNEGGQ